VDLGLIFDIAQTLGLAYLARRAYKPKVGDLQAAVREAIAKRIEQAGGRERLRMRLAQRLAEREAKAQAEAKS
jgi:hypothetical protein